MKFVVAVLLIFVSLQLHAQSQTARAAEDLKYLSEKFANDYLFLLYNPNHFKYIPKLQYTIKKIEEDLRIIAKNTHNEDIRSILDYLSYTKDELQDLLDDDIDRENAEKVLDNSDALVEGVDSILKSLHESLFKEELQYQIMQLSKLYMAIHLKIDPAENTKKLYKVLHVINRMIQNTSKNVYVTWHAYKTLFNPVPLYFVPHIVTIAVEDLEESINRL